MSFANIYKGNQLRLRRPDSPIQEHGDAIVRDSHPLPQSNKANRTKIESRIITPVSMQVNAWNKNALLLDGHFA